MCGMTRREDIDYALQLGVDAIGLVFVPESPRYITLDEAAILLKDLPPFVTAVAVFDMPEAGFVRELLMGFPLLTLQFHGQEPSVFCNQFNVPYIKAVAVENAEQVLKAEQEYDSASALLLDNVQGGSGIPFDWKNIPAHINKPWILAGGLRAENVSHALELCTPWAVDVCNGVEWVPGIKDKNRMQAFVEACKVNITS